nr:immunoglobulin heavy chain junction region [Mus musculus]MBK4186720.1 immunoglobulin heavy chain junction region [Mus musculus]MBK4186721.1 immunoglobulin heavy chain junction region [Mus musculus]
CARDYGNPYYFDYW